MKTELHKAVEKGRSYGIYEEEVTNDAVDHLQQICHGASRDAGWWKPGDTDNPLMFSNKLCLTHSEISEAMEGDRKNLMDDKLPHRKMAEVELADVLIRVFDYAGAYGFDLDGAVAEKRAFNASRADHKAEARLRANGKQW